MLDNSILERLLDAATHHGRDSEPDHEVGDLQDYSEPCGGCSHSTSAKHSSNEGSPGNARTGLGEDASAALLAEAFQL